MSALGEYNGNCHCKAFRYTVGCAEIRTVSECKCSLCVKKGYLFLENAVSRAVELTIHTGEEHLKEYWFGEKEFGHSFCTTCGSAVFRTRPDGTSDINVRMINGLDINSLEISTTNSTSSTSSLETITKSASSELDDKITYQGSCHCKSVTYTVYTAPLSTQKIMSCNCSLCSRNRDFWIYPPKKDVVINKAENLTGYAFLSEDSLHSFCGSCGVSICVRVLDEKEDVCPVNVRTLEDIDLTGLTFQYYDGWKNEPVYTV